MEINAARCVLTNCIIVYTLLQDLFLSRVFGFSFHFPICLTRLEALQVALFGFIPPILILMSVITYTML